MKAVICGEPLEGKQQQAHPSHLAQYPSESRDKCEWCSKPKYLWRAEDDAYLKANYFGGLNRPFHVLDKMVRLTGLPRWDIKRHGAGLGLTLTLDARASPASE